MSQLRKTALFVDDEETIRHLLSRQLGELGYECVTASGGQEALEKADRQKFALVMLDVKMPGMSGLEVLRKLRPGHPGACFVMLSAVVDAVIAAEAMRLGADDYLTKPCDLDYLSARLQEAQEKRKRARPPDGGSSSSGGKGSKLPRQVDLAEVTRDLVWQQVAVYERITLSPTMGSEAPGRSRRWWSWA